MRDFTGYDTSTKSQGSQFNLHTNNFNSHRRGFQITDKGAKLKALCWCQRKVVKVPCDDIRRGITSSCGLSNCTPNLVRGGSCES